MQEKIKIENKVEQFNTMEELINYGHINTEKQKQIDEQMVMLQQRNVQVTDRHNADTPSDIPQQTSDEKEEKEKRKQRKKDLSAGVSSLNIEYRKRQKEEEKNGKPISKPWGKVQFFSEYMDITQFTPEYIQKNLAQVRLMLDRWNENLTLAKTEELSPEQKERFHKMNKMYEVAEVVFADTLQNMGYSLERQKKGTWKLIEHNRKAASIHKDEQHAARLKLQALSDELLENDIKVLQEKAEKERQEEQEKKSSEKDEIGSKFLVQEGYRKNLLDLKALLENNREQYEKNRELLDRMYGEYQHLLEAMAVYSEKYSDNKKILYGETEYQKEQEKLLANMPKENEEPDYENMEFKIVEGHLSEPKMKASDKVADALTKENQFYLEAINLLQSRAASVKAIIAHHVKETELTKKDEEVFKSFEIEGKAKPESLSSRVRIELHERKEQLFLQLCNQEEQFSQQDKALCISLMQEDKAEQNKNVIQAILEIRKEKSGNNPDEKKIGEIAKSILLPVLEEIRDYDTSLLQDCPDELLEERNGELQRLAGLSTYLGDLVKYPDPDTQVPIGESVYKDKPSLFSLKMKMIRNYADRARILSMLRSYNNKALTEQSFTSEEQKKIREFNKLSEHEKLRPSHLKAYVSEMMIQNQITIGKDYNSYFHNEEALEAFIVRKSRKPESLFKGIEEKINQAVKHVGTMMGEAYIEKSNMEETIYWSNHNKVEQINDRIEKLKKTGGEEEQIRKLQEEAEALMEQAKLLEIHQALMVQGFSLADQKEGENKFPSALIRSFSGLKAFEGMTEEDMLTMMKQLSAGYFDKKRNGITSEELAAYKAKNIQGLQTYKKWIHAYYARFDEILHHRVPSLEYMEEHFEELMDATTGMQEHNYVTMFCNEIMDLTKEEDQKLRQNINDTNNVISHVIGVLNMLFNGMDYEQIEKISIN